MFTKKKVLITSSRFSALIGISFSLIKEGWFIALMFFVVLVTFFFVIPAILTRLLLKKDEREEVDGELYLWNDDNRIDYRLTINAVGEVPFKEYLKIRVNESARDESLLSKKHTL
jgi:hypothetical protein